MLLLEEIKKNGTEMKFKDLPIEAKKSLIFYMAVDGDAWLDIIGKKNLNSNEDWDVAIKKVTATHGNTMYILYNMPTDIFKSLIMQSNSDFADSFDTFQEYHMWYLKGGGIPNYTQENRWPALADDDDEGLIDGWHRTHAYIKSNHSTVPLIY